MGKLQMKALHLCARVSDRWIFYLERDGPDFMNFLFEQDIIRGLDKRALTRRSCVECPRRACVARDMRKVTSSCMSGRCLKCNNGNDSETYRTLAKPELHEDGKLYCPAHPDSEWYPTWSPPRELSQEENREIEVDDCKECGGSGTVPGQGAVIGYTVTLMKDDAHNTAVAALARKISKGITKQTKPLRVYLNGDGSIKHFA